VEREEFREHMDQVRDKMDHILADTFAEFFLALNERETERFIKECLRAKETRRGRIITFFTEKYWLACPNPTHTVRRRPSPADDA
jgi:hypothetical protein